MSIESRAAVKDREHRAFDFGTVEFRESSDTAVVFEGVASVVDRPYQVRDMFGTFTETISAGAFTKTLKDSKADIALFVNHRSENPPLATRMAGSLELAATPDLTVRASMDPMRPDVQTVRSAVTRGELSQMSIGFSVPKDRQTWNDTFTERTIHEVKLVEASIVWRGANPYTCGAVRSLDDLLSEIDCDDPDQIRRAIAHLETLLRSDEPVAVEARDLPYIGMFAELQAKRELV